MQGALQASGRRIYFFGALGGCCSATTRASSPARSSSSRRTSTSSLFMQGAVVASLLLGAMVGAALAGPGSDRLGRRRLIMIAAVTFTVGAIAASAAPSAWALVGARFVLGLAVAVPLWWCRSTSRRSRPPGCAARSARSTS